MNFELIGMTELNEQELMRVDGGKWKLNWLGAAIALVVTGNVAIATVVLVQPELPPLHR